MKFRILLTCLLIVACCFFVQKIQADDKSSKNGNKQTTESAKKEKAEFTKIGKNLIENFIAGEYEKATTDLGDNLRKIVTPEWFKNQVSYLKNFGEFKKTNYVRAVVLKDIWGVYIFCDFEKVKVKFTVKIYEDKKVLSFYTAPLGQNIKFEYPKYAKSESFSETEITIKTGQWEIPGTLTIPKKDDTKFPLVIIVHGSGPNDRDGTMFNNKAYRDIAWGLASKGIAVLRYDKRTFAYEIVPHFTVKEEFLVDVSSAIKLMKKTPKINPNLIFVAGHSEGGQLIPRIGKLNPDIAGLIMLAGPARPLEDISIEQVKYLTSYDGNVTELEKKYVEDMKKRIELVKSADLKEDTPASKLPSLGFNGKYWLDLRSYKQVEVAKELKHPMYILQGERDYQVTMEDFNLWKKALGDRKNVTFKSYPKLHHTFMVGSGKGKKSINLEYFMKQHVEEEVIDDIANWIKDTIKKNAKAAVKKELTKKAVEFVDNLVDGKYEDATKDFNDTMKKQVTLEMFNELQGGFAKQLGEFKKFISIDFKKTEKFCVVCVNCEFEKFSITIRVVINKEKKISGFNYLPYQPPADYKAPKYVNNSLFTEEEVKFGTKGWELPGTLSIPKGEGVFPAVVLVHGSGPNDRDETILKNKPFKDLAWGLASKGVAVLRYDKRTKVHGAKLVKSKAAYTIKDEVIDDAIYAVEFLRKRKKINPRQIFVIGHSLGGMCIPRIGKRDEKIAGLVMLAGPSRPLEDLIFEQYHYILGLDGEISIEDLGILKKIMEQTKNAKSDELSEKTPVEDLPLGGNGKYWLDLRNYKQKEIAKEIKHPMLILQGERDYQVTMLDFKGWKNALKGNGIATFKSYPKLHHLFMEGNSKEKSTPSEYNLVQHVAEYVITDIQNWIKKISKNENK